MKIILFWVALICFNVFSATTTLIVPSGSTSVRAPIGVTTFNTVAAFGAGGASGVGYHDDSPVLVIKTGAGGGGAAAATISSYSVTPGTTYAVSIGFGSSGNDGGDTTFINAGTLKAVGGKKAVDTTAGAGGLASDCVGTTKHSGGTGGVGISGEDAINHAAGSHIGWHGGGGGGAGGSTADGSNGNFDPQTGGSYSVDGGVGGGTSPTAGGSGGNGGLSAGNFGQSAGGLGGGGPGNGAPGTHVDATYPSVAGGNGSIVIIFNIPTNTYPLTVTSDNSFVADHDGDYDLDIWGAGGSSTSTGAGAGAYIHKTVSLFAGSTYTLTVGVATAGDHDGTDSIFADFSSTYAKAKGGSGGASPTGGSKTLSIGDVRRAGGNGSASGGGGASPGTLPGGFGVDATSSSGATAATGGGNGGNSGGNGTVPGGGGGLGGTGANGKIIITYPAASPASGSGYVQAITTD